MRYKFLFPVVLSIALGLFFGKVFFDNYDGKAMNVFSDKDSIYMLEIGVYNSKENMEKDFSDYNKYLYILKDDGYHLYIGITKSKENVSRIKEFYERQGYSIYVRENIIDNNQFMSVLIEYDKILNIANSEDLPEIQKLIIQNYKELVEESDNKTNT